jgi:hypothetical protein
MREAIGHNAHAIDMKLTIALFSIVLTLGFGACSTAKISPHDVTFTSCCSTGAPDKVVVLQDSFEPGGTVVRLIH